MLNVLAIANIPRTAFHERFGQAFLSSCVTITCLVFLRSMALFPKLVTASNEPALGLTIYTAASSQATLWIMFIFAMIGMPLVLMYTRIVYRTFHGKVGSEQYGSRGALGAAH